MSFPSQNSLHGTILQLREIVKSLQGEDHEAWRVIRQMEALVLEIERKTTKQGKASSTSAGAVATASAMTPTPAPTTV